MSSFSICTLLVLVFLATGNAMSAHIKVAELHKQHNHSVAMSAHIKVAELHKQHNPEWNERKLNMHLTDLDRDLSKHLVGLDTSLTITFCCNGVDAEETVNPTDQIIAKAHEICSGQGNEKVTFGGEEIEGTNTFSDWGIESDARIDVQLYEADEKECFAQIKPVGDYMQSSRSFVDEVENGYTGKITYDAKSPEIIYDDEHNEHRRMTEMLDGIDYWCREYHWAINGQCEWNLGGGEVENGGAKEKMDCDAKFQGLCRPTNKRFDFGKKNVVEVADGEEDLIMGCEPNNNGYAPNCEYNVVGPGEDWTPDINNLENTIGGNGAYPQVRGTLTAICNTFFVAQEGDGQCGFWLDHFYKPLYTANDNNCNAKFRDVCVPTTTPHHEIPGLFICGPAAATTL